MDRILILLLLVVISFIDINKKLIPNFLNILLFILALFFKLDNLENFFIGAGLYTLPIIFLYGYGSDLMNREVIGFGDIKLIISLGGLLYSNEINIFIQLYIFYLLIFLIASAYILLLFIYKLYKNVFQRIEINLKNRELAFAPFIILSFVINYYFINLRGLLCLNELFPILK